MPEVALEAQLPEPEGTAVVRVRHGRGHTLRRFAQRTTEIDEQWAEIEVPYRRGTTERDVVALGTHAVAVSPPELVDGRPLGAAGGGPGTPRGHRRQSSGHARDVAIGGTGMSGSRRSAARRPAETATQRLGRLLDMVPWLLQHRGVPIAEAAREFGVDEDQVVEDLELLFVCGTPGYGHAELIDAQWDSGHIYLDNADDIAAPMRLTRDEAVTLTAGLQALGSTLVGSDVAERTLDKIRAAAATTVGEPTGRIDLDLDDGSQHPAMATLKDAFARGRRVHLRYYVATRDESTERDVDIMRILNLDAQWYVEGYCHRAEDVRLFRLDRIEDAAVLDVDGTPPAAGASPRPRRRLRPRRERPHRRHRGEPLGGLDRGLLPQRGGRARARRVAAGDPQGRRPGSRAAPRAAPRGRGARRRAAGARRRRGRRGALRAGGLRPSPAVTGRCHPHGAHGGPSFTGRTYAGHLQHRGCTMTVPIRTGLRRGDVTMPNLGAPELIIIAVVLIALFGWKKLPDMARSLGRSARVFKSEVDELKKDGKPVPQRRLADHRAR